MLQVTLTCALCLSSPAAGVEVDFDRDIAPLLIRRCLECHNDAGRSGGLRLTEARTLRQGGDGGPAVTADDAQSSLLLRRVLADEMPPPRNEIPQPLPEAEKAVLEQLALAGSPGPEARVLVPYE